MTGRASRPAGFFIDWRELPRPDLAPGDASLRRLVTEPPSAVPVLEALDDVLAAWRGRELLLGFSGGAESSLLGLRLRSLGLPCRFLLLQGERGGRDRAAAAAAAKALGLACDTLVVSDDELLATLAAGKAWLSPLPDYTQRVLALCEFLLARAAAQEGRQLILGHGPEALLGGFRRRARPAESEIVGRLALNVRRLDAVARAAAAVMLLPFLAAPVFASLLALRRAGAAKASLITGLRPDLAPPALKSSLQNGSGLHYRLVKLARAAGCRYTRDFMERQLA